MFGLKIKTSIHNSSLMDLNSIVFQQCAIKGNGGHDAKSNGIEKS